MWTMTPEDIEEQEKLDTLWKARGVVRKYLPYGLFRNVENGKILLFNREYEVIEIAGQREFDIDLAELIEDFAYIADARFLLTDDGHGYVGTMYWLYCEESPFYFEKENMIHYFNKVEKVFSQIIKCPGNGYNKRTATKEQYNRVKALHKKYYPYCYTKKNKHS